MEPYERIISIRFPLEFMIVYAHKACFTGYNNFHFLKVLIFRCLTILMHNFNVLDTHYISCDLCEEYVYGLSYFAYY